MQSPPFSCSIVPPPQVSYSASCAKIPSAYFLPSVWETKFHTRIKQQAKLALVCEIAKYDFQRDPANFAASVLVAISSEKKLETTNMKVYQ